MTKEEYDNICSVMRPLRSPCIVELGAHTGEDFTALSNACSESPHYILVEPDPRNCQHILDRAPTSRTRRLIIGAVAEKEGMMEFHHSYNFKTKDMGSGSLRQPTGHLDMDWITFPFKSMVRCYSLDDIFEKEWLTRIDLLWTDIQGSENLMVRGGQTALKHTRYLFVEVETVELYAGQALEKDIYDILPGWKLLRRFEQNALLQNMDFSERSPR